MKRLVSQTRLAGIFILLLSALFLPWSTASGDTVPLSYPAITDTSYKPTPPLPVWGPANSVITDPTFGSRILRATDGETAVGTSTKYQNRSFMIPSSAEQNVWNADGTKFSANMGYQVYFDFDPVLFKATPIKKGQYYDPKFGITIPQIGAEPTFSYTDPNLVYGTSDGTAIKQYDFGADTVTALLDVKTVLGSSTTLGFAKGISIGVNEVIATFIGPQDDATYVLVYDTNGHTTHLLDSANSTIDGVPLTGGQTLGWTVHNVRIDRSGRYVVITVHNYDPDTQSGFAVWDLQTNQVYYTTGGHKAEGYGDMVSFTGMPGDYGPQFALEGLTYETANSVTALVLKHPNPPSWGYDAHLSWNNAQSEHLVPVLGSSYHDSRADDPQAYLGDEIFAVETDGTTPTAWRFAHHRSIYDGGDFTAIPRANISQDGRFALFDSNWENTLGTAPDSGYPRCDAFIVDLMSSHDTHLPPSDTIPPSVPAGLTATAVSSSVINLTWSASTDNVGVTGYKIYMKGGLGYSCTSAISDSYGGLSPSRAYTFTVSAYDHAGNESVQSSPASATTFVNIPMAPSISSFTAHPAAITPGSASTLSWSETGNPTPTLSIDQGVGAVTGTLKVVSPTVTTTYTLTATNNVSSTSKSATVTVYAPGASQPPSSALSAVKAYPNPWRKDQHPGGITFAGLPANPTVKIFTASGHLVRAQRAASGEWVWDLKNDQGVEVARGVYLYVITDGQGNKQRGKVVVIR